MTATRTQIWSSGGGVQSAAIAALICMGDIAPPDLAVIVDTERELSTTWDYMNSTIAPALLSVGVTLQRVPKSKYATVDLLGGKDGDDILIPAFTTQSGEMGKLPTYCSNEWKSRVARRWATDQGVTQADFWMGFSIDEKRRAKIVLGKWQCRFPLLEKRMNRQDCIKLVLSMGWPMPPRSSCWMCPNHTHDEWQWIKENAPSDFHKAADFQQAIQVMDPHLWLSDSPLPLNEIDFTRPDDLISTCKSGECFV
jgi:hypothetical protein